MVRRVGQSDETARQWGLVTQFTNLDTSETLTTDTSGPGRFTFFPDGSLTLEGWGNWFNFYDVVPVGAPSAAFLSHGRFMLTVDAAGNVTKTASRGPSTISV